MSWKPISAMRGLEAGALHVWRARFHDLEDDAVQLRRLLSSEELARADRYRLRSVGRRFIIGRAVLRSLLGDYLRLSPRKIALKTGEHGKPRLADDEQGRLQFNLAHSGDLLLCVFCRDHPVGIDVETLRPLDRTSYLERTFLTIDERRLLHTLSTSDQQRVLMAACVCKEAYGKGHGTGIRAASDLTLLTPQTLSWFLGRGSGSISGTGSAWHLHRIDPATGYVGALATVGPVRSILRYDVSPSLLQI